LDQTVRRGESDSGSQVDNRVFARLLEFLEDPARRGKVLVVAATNRPDLLDAALRSRFDRTLPVLPPTAEDRVAIIAQMAQAAGLPLHPTMVEDIETRTEGWTGRNLRDFMAMVGELHEDGLPPDDALLEALELYRPSLRESAAMTMLALREITDLRLVPPEHRAAVAGAQETPGDESGTRQRRAQL
jgi:SpoVK/Ycf46/Vps4 family AAA+-type ATPase